MLQHLPPDCLAAIAESVQLAAAMVCCHDLLASLRLARPLLGMRTASIGDALAVHANGLWRIASLTLVDSEAISLASIGCASNTWDIFAITAIARDAVNREAEVVRKDRSLAPCVQFTWLTSLTLDGWDVGEHGLSSLANLPRLERLSLIQLKVSSPVAALACIPSLTSLELSSCWKIVDLEGLGACRRLAHLGLNQYKGSTLHACSTLRSVHVTNSIGLNDVWALSACPLLEQLRLSICHGVKDLSPLADCSALVHLELDRCTGIKDLAPLSTCGMLRSLTLSRCPSVTDLSVLEACVSLSHLSVLDCAGLMHFSSPCRVARALVRIRSVVGNGLNRQPVRAEPEEPLASPTVHACRDSIGSPGALQVHRVFRGAYGTPHDC